MHTHFTTTKAAGFFVGVRFVIVSSKILAHAFGARGYVYHTVLGNSRKTNIGESLILEDFDNVLWSRK